MVWKEIEKKKIVLLVYELDINDKRLVPWVHGLLKFFTKSVRNDPFEAGFRLKQHIFLYLRLITSGQIKDYEVSEDNWEWGLNSALEDFKLIVLAEDVVGYKVDLGLWICHLNDSVADSACFKILMDLEEIIVEI